MPEIARFFGIVITVFFNDHDPPHIHASHGERRGRYTRTDWVAKITIAEGRVVEGYIPARDLKLVRQWLQLHRKEVLAAWATARRGETPAKVPPLRVR